MGAGASATNFGFGFGFISEGILSSGITKLGQSGQLGLLPA
jgi:hypothetical protein